MTTREKNARYVRSTLGMASVLATAACLAAGGCATTVLAPTDRPPTGLRTAGLGSSAAAVFAGPEVDAALEGVQVAALPEATRNDRHLGYRPREPYSALDAWPEPGIPDIGRRRTTTFIRNDRSFIFFESERTRRPSYGRGY